MKLYLEAPYGIHSSGLYDLRYVVNVYKKDINPTLWSLLLLDLKIPIDYPQYIQQGYTPSDDGLRCEAVYYDDEKIRIFAEYNDWDFLDNIHVLTDFVQSLDIYIDRVYFHDDEKVVEVEPDVSNFKNYKWESDGKGLPYRDFINEYNKLNP